MTPDAMLYLASKGLSVGEIAEFMRLNAGGQSNDAPSKAALRMRKYRENREANGMSKTFVGSDFRDQLKARDGDTCVYCLEAVGTVVDHMWPISRGGTDDIQNLALACHRCNCGKSGRTVEESGYAIRVSSAHANYVRYTNANMFTNDVRREREHVREPSCVRDKDINLTSVDIPNLTTLKCVSERVDADAISWPPPEPAHGPYLDQLAAVLRKAGGSALSPVSPNLISLAPILALGRAGKGQPCDLYADILPVIEARASRSKPNTISTWGYFTEAIREARDRRLAGAPASREILTYAKPNSPAEKSQRRQAAHAADFAGSDLAIELRAQRG